MPSMVNPFAYQAQAKNPSSEFLLELMTLARLSSSSMTNRSPFMQAMFL